MKTTKIALIGILLSHLAFAGNTSGGGGGELACRFIGKYLAGTTGDSSSPVEFARMILVNHHYSKLELFHKEPVVASGQKVLAVLNCSDISTQGEEIECEGSVQGQNDPIAGDDSIQVQFESHLIQSSILGFLNFRYQGADIGNVALVCYPGVI